jgi:hypothetical protein
VYDKGVDRERKRIKLDELSRYPIHWRSASTFRQTTNNANRRQDNIMKVSKLLESYAAGERDFSRADLTNVDLRGVDLRGADLRGADLSGANLRGADLRGADLCDAKGIVAFYGIGANRYLNFCYQYEGVVRFQIGCFNGTYDEAVEKTKWRYEELGKQRYTDSHLLMLAAARAALLAQLEDSGS